MDMDNKEPKKCFCARCFLPVEADDKVDIEGQNFHRICSMCCVCRSIPVSLKMFYGHVFCNECFKTHVLSRFRGEGPKMQTNSWWMQWAPGPKPQDGTSDKTDTKSKTEEPQRRCICSRCLLAVEEADKVDIGNQSFHPQCAKCYFCHEVPTKNVKIYYGQVFCEECFNKHVLSRGRNNPSEFFKTCFEQWQNNAQFADNMRQFMASNKECSPFVFMMQGQPSCRCGAGNDWGNHGEARKSVTSNTRSIEEDSASILNLTIENRTDDELPESRPESPVEAAEKIEKLTKYLHEESDLKIRKKWKNFMEIDKISMTSDFASGWVDIQDTTVELKCPKCLWQSGLIYVNSELLNSLS